MAAGRRVPPPRPCLFSRGQCWAWPDPCIILQIYISGGGTTGVQNGVDVNNCIKRVVTFAVRQAKGEQQAAFVMGSGLHVFWRGLPALADRGRGRPFHSSRENHPGRPPALQPTPAATRSHAATRVAHIDGAAGRGACSWRLRRRRRPLQQARGTSPLFLRRRRRRHVCAETKSAHRVDRVGSGWGRGRRRRQSGRRGCPV